MNQRGRFIVFEGGEACGKSTQARRLAERLDALFTFEPGATDLGQLVREMVLDHDNHHLDARAEALLIAADKAQHVHSIIEPTLASGRDVVCDRFVDSALAYQGFGRGLDLEQLERVLDFATGALRPDLVLLLEVPDRVAEARLGGQRDRLEAESPSFHRRVRDGFRTLAGADPERWAVIDGDGSVEEVSARIDWVLHERLAARAAPGAGRTDP
ncbi:MAG: dTMP kinase [Actinobacteria bacterium]|nr:MAG: dTMP kinase [Actinomycetota bacterium]